jgi:hypothetical protein
MTDEEYRNIQALSASGMHALSRSPAHYHQWVTSYHEATPAMELGTSTHMAILEPVKFFDTYIPNECEQDAAPHIKAAETKRLKKQHPNHIILPSASFIAVTGMRERVLEHPFVASLMEGSENEKVITWVDSTSGANCKGRLDIFKNGIIADIKTTYDARLFQYTIEKYHLHRQAAFYLDGAEAKEFYWIVVEKQSPYGVIVYKASNALLQSGSNSYSPLAIKYKECCDTGMWPGYDTDIVELDNNNESMNTEYDECPF